MGGSFWRNLVNRFGFLFVLLFVAASIGVALAYHRWQGSLAGQANFSSELAVFEPAKPEDFEFEKAEECGATRTYLESEIEKFPPVFRDARARAAADFPRACLTYMMKRQRLTGERAGFAQCPAREGAAQAGAAHPCVSENYVNVVYNFFGDVTSCFEIPQKEFLPKLFAESGFHLNAMSAAFDAGIGQLSPVEIQQANASFESFKARAASSDAEACKRLHPYLSKVQALPAGENACGLMMPPQNPLRNLVYLAIKYDQQAKAVQKAMERYKINQLLRQAGMKGFEPEQLQQFLITLGFDTGPVAAVLYLKAFTEARLQAIQNGLAGPLQDSDFDLTGGSNGRGLASGEPGAMSFGSYLAAYQISGSSDFLFRVKAHATVLNTIFKEGTCVSDSYLSLSSSL